MPISDTSKARIPRTTEITSYVCNAIVSKYLLTV